ncbi:MAG: serine/threonine protein kinase [Gemmataceae bacterium]|nr:serine/threonine protein kinase [Gemmataceae bacterium]
MAAESPDAALESRIGAIADEFTRRHQRGDNPRLDEYTERYPELAELLRDILPAIQALRPAQSLAETPHGGATPGSPLAPREAGHPLAEREICLADYEVLGEIGRGGMGVVYKARHRTLGRIVALKMLQSTDAADLERFRSEAQAVARLQHPNVVQIFEVQETSGRPFLALEYVDGGSLAERTKGEPQLPRQAAALIETLARAIAAAHESGLVHRDLKPSNVLLEVANCGLPNAAAGDSVGTSAIGDLQSAIPKVTDFGLAKRLDQDLGQTQSGAIVGTPSYMAPEQATDGARVGPAADIFALGAILYELIVGRPPFKGPSVVETLELVRHAEPTPPAQLQPGCPRDLETICLTCLHKEPARRFASAAALADDLRRFQNGEPIHARPVGSLERLAKWLRRRPAVPPALPWAPSRRSRSWPSRSALRTRGNSRTPTRSSARRSPPRKPR